MAHGGAPPVGATAVGGGSCCCAPSMCDSSTCAGGGAVGGIAFGAGGASACCSTGGCASGCCTTGGCTSCCPQCIQLERAELEVHRATEALESSTATVTDLEARNVDLEGALEKLRTGSWKTRFAKEAAVTELAFPQTTMGEQRRKGGSVYRVSKNVSKEAAYRIYWRRAPRRLHPPLLSSSLR